MAPGEVTGNLGPNGYGKSTTVKILAGLLNPASGQILWQGRNIREDLIGFKRQLGYVPDALLLPASLALPGIIQESIFSPFSGSSKISRARSACGGAREARAAGASPWLYVHHLFRQLAQSPDQLKVLETGEVRIDVSLFR